MKQLISHLITLELRQRTLKGRFFFSGNLFIPKSDKYVISHNSITPESNTKIIRLEEMIMNSKSS